MRATIILATLCFGGLAGAQANHFEIYSGCTNYTSRGTLGVNAGEFLIQVPGSNFAGICQDATGTGTSLTSFQYQTQDQNAATQSTYSLIARADADGKPDVAATGTLLRLGPLVTPPSTWPGLLAWSITTTIATPATVLPLCGSYYLGLELEAAPRWFDDGQSIHICTYYRVGFSQADNPAPPPDPVPNLAWSIEAGTRIVGQPDPCALRLGVGSPAPVLNLGNVDATMSAMNCLIGANRSWGVGGIWPASNANGGGIRDDGIDARVRDRAHANGRFAVFASDQFGCPGLPMPVWSGAIYLNLPALTWVGTGSIDAEGVGIVTLLPWGTRVPLAVLGRAIPFQAVTLGPSAAAPARLTNAAAATFL